MQNLLITHQTPDESLIQHTDTVWSLTIKTAFGWESIGIFITKEDARKALEAYLAKGKLKRTELMFLPIPFYASADNFLANHGIKTMEEFNG